MISFPDWPMSRTIEEALADWNLRHSEKLDPEGSEWSLVFKAILAFLRHKMSNYDEVRRERPEERERFYREVQGKAQRHYPWLRPEVDPRRAKLSGEELPPAGMSRPFDCAASYLADRYADKNALLSYGRETRSPEERKAVRQVVKYLEEDIAQVEGLFKSDGLWCGTLETGLRYALDFDRFNFNHLRDTRIKCPACGARIWQVKRPVPVGQRLFWRVWRCDCAFAGIPLPLPKDSRVKEGELRGGFTVQKRRGIG
jgi:hypothetical protein